MPAPVAGARATVLLVLDGLGWEALDRFPDRAARAAGVRRRARSPPSCRRPPPAALTSITTGLPPSRHGITGFRLRHDDGRAQRASAGSWPTASAPPDPEHVQKAARCSAGGRCRWSPRPMFRTTGFTAAHLRGTDFHGWQTTSVLVEHVRALVAGGAPFVYAYYPGVDEVAHALRARRRRTTRPSSRAADRLVGDVLDALPDDAALAGHRRPRPGAGRARRLAHASPRCDSMVETYAGDGRFRLPARASRAPPPSCTRRRRQLVGADAWVFRRERAARRGVARPRPGARDLPARRRRRARGARPVGFVDPTLPYEARPARSAHGSLTAAEMEVPLVAGPAGGT